jgi:hypothetical protein
MINGWPPVVALGSQSWDAYLATQGWDPNVETIFIFDEAQKTYRDTGLWGQLFKDIGSHHTIYSKAYAIGFVGFGSATSAIDLGDGTPMIIPAKQRISLRAIDHGDSFPAAGLLFSKKEFDDFMHRKVTAKEDHFDTSFLDHLFEITGGHIGAICDVKDKVKAQGVSSIAY